MKTALTTLALSGSLALASAQTISNPSFEANSFTNYPGYISGNTQIVGWTSGDTNRVGLNPVTTGGPPNPFADNGTVPDGTNVAFIQSFGGISSLSTVISNLTVGQTYKVNFRVNARSGVGSTPNLKVSIGGTNIINSAVTPVGSNPYKYFAFDFTAAATNQTMTLTNDAGADQTVLLDNFSIALRDSGWSYAAWNDDASSGLDGTKTYTHAYNFGSSSNTTINGVAFTGTGSATVNPSVINSFSTAGLPNVSNDTNGIVGASRQLATNFLWGGAVESITLNGLHVGNSYVATIYSVGFDSIGSRAATFSVGNDRLTVNQDQFLNDIGIRVSYAYTAVAQLLTISNAALQGSFTFHTYGFSNVELTNSHAAFLIVTNLADSGPGTLRQVIANASPGETITFDPALSGKTNVLTSGQLLIPYGLTLDASALPGGFKISGQPISRVFEVAASTVVTLNSLTIQDGSYINGGGIFVNSGASLTLTNCTLSGNSADVFGGGGIYQNGGTLTINGSTFSGNSANPIGGGGINQNGGTLTINGSTFSGNSASSGGGIYQNGGTLTINNSTFSGNSANSIGGGLYLPGGTSYLTNTIVAGNSANLGPNIFGSFSGANNLTNGTPLLAPLDNYGGPTATMRPRPGSPAIDAGLDSITNLLATDQRGYPRRFGAHVDIGAVEAQVTVVSNLNNSGVGSLRAALAAPTELVGFDVGLSGGTLTLTSGQVTIFSDVTIDATALASGLAISGNHASRIFEVVSGASVTVASLSLINGNALNGGASLVGSGAALTLASSIVSSNSASYGGGIINYGALTLRDSYLANNLATNSGGGIDNDYGATLLLNNSTLSGNSAGGFGGGLNNYQATATINNSTLYGNSAGFGGALYNVNTGTVTLVNATLFGNSANSGAGAGGGIYQDNSAGLCLLTNTIVAGNIAAGATNNISGSFSGANNLTNGTPLLALLGNHGGPTPTMPPLHGSPAIDAGLDSITTFLATDQRGLPRQSGAHVDIGAVEAQWALAGNPPSLKSPVRASDGTFSFSFTHPIFADFTVLAGTNVALPLGQWTVLAPATQVIPGSYQFTDPGATNYPRRFYDVVSP